MRPNVKKGFVVFDEVFQLPDPSRLLKIGADGFPRLQILATGSSTLAATQKFRDSLTGRKRVVEFVPVLHEELPAFGIADVRERLLRGGKGVIVRDRPRLAFSTEEIDDPGRVAALAKTMQPGYEMKCGPCFLSGTDIITDVLFFR